MVTAEPSSEDRERRLDEAIARYLQLQAAGQTPERDAWLAQFPDLGDELAAFLDDAARVQAVLNPGSDQAQAAPTTAAHVVHQVAAGMCVAERFWLEQKLGEGGMGEVWVARQVEPVKRRVALKLIKVGMDSRAVLVRFEAERQALALMEHPNIAKVLDGGLTRERHPFFVMELVNGLPLTRFCDEARLTPTRRLELFVQVCHGVQHAHQKGIVHRDLKPSNILVTLYDGKPVPKIIDFGVAKAMAGKLGEDSILTGFGAVVGTLEYMSPEQAGFSALDVDTRADIYSLGVILYELLTGLRPIDAKRLKLAAFTEMIRIIQEEEPSKPSTRLSTDESLPSLAALRQMEPKKLMAQLRGELDWVVMKCLEKQRDRRYETANGLARDIQRFLADETVEARPPSAAYRCAKFFKRNKGPVIAATLVMFAVLAGMVGTAIGLVRAETARRAESEQRREAELANQRALQALRSFTDELMVQQLAGKTTLSENEKSILRNALKQWNVFAQSKGTSDVALAIRAEGAVNVARVQCKLGLIAEGEANYRTALATYELLPAELINVPEIQSDLGTIHQNLGVVLQSLGKNADAEEQHRQAIAIGAKLVARFPAEPKYQAAMAARYNSLGVLRIKMGQLADGEQQFQKALAIRAKLAEEFPAVLAYRSDLAGDHQNLGILLVSLGKPAEAEVRYRQSLAIQEQLAAEFPATPEHRFGLATTQNSLGVWLEDRGKWAEAMDLYRRAVAIRKQLAADFPAAPEYRKTLAESHHNLGNLFARQNNPLEAEQQFRQALAINERLAAESSNMPEYSFDLAKSCHRLGKQLGELGKAEEAKQLYGKGIAILEQLATQFPHLPDYRRGLASHQNDLGLLLGELGKTAEAEQQYRKALTIQERLAVEFPLELQYRVDLGGSYCNLAGLITNSDGPRDSLEWYKKAIEVLAAAYSEAPQSLVAKRYLRNSHANRAVCFGLLRDYAEAAKDWNLAVELSPPEEQLSVRSGRVESLLRSGQVVEAVAEVAELTENRSWPPDQWYNFACVCSVASGKTMDKQKEYADLAIELLAKSVQTGFKDAANMARDTDLDPLRERQDFKKLLAELQAQK